MKPSLGKILFIWIIAVGELWGAYQWSVLDAPKTLVVGQSGVVRYECRFDSSAAEYSIKLKFEDTPTYKATILTEQDRVVGGKRIETFDVLVTPKISGAIKVNTEAVVRFTGLGAVENTVLGRDNLSKDDIVEEKAILPSVALVANKNTMALTGSKLMFEVRADTRSVRAHEPMHLSVTVRGEGNLDEMIPYELNISGVKVFTQLPQKSLTPSAQGFEGEVSQEFALVASKSYTIEPLSLSYFDTVKNQTVTFKSKPIYVEVGEGYEPSNLLDPPTLRDWSTLARYGLYGALVLAGVALGESARRLWKLRPRRKAKQFWDEAKSSKELVMLLSLFGDKQYELIIAELEAGKLDLQEGKKMLDKICFDNKR